MRLRTIALVLLLLGMGATALALALRPVADPLPTYEVARGDTLFKIGRAHGVTVDALRAANGIEGDLIEVGQILQIPAADPDADLSAYARKGAARKPATARKTGQVRAGAHPRPAPAAAPAALKLPAEKRCLAGPTGVDGDHAMAASAGLTHAQVSSAMSAFVHKAARCITGATPSSALDLEITVACTGRVSSVRVLDAGDWPGPASTCVRDVLRYVPFPAHDLPDGETFRYPLRFTPG